MRPLYVLSSILLIAVYSIEAEVPIKLEKNTNFLIVGSSVPALVAGYILSQYGKNVTISYGTPYVDNRISRTVTVIGGEKYILPKMQPVIYENSKKSQHLVNHIGLSPYSENGFYIHFQNRKYLSVSASISLDNLVKGLVDNDCLSGKDVRLLAPLLALLRNYDYNAIRSKFSRMSLTDFGKLLRLPESFMNCAVNLFTVMSGMNQTSINAADALARVIFYFFNSTSPLRSYYLKGDTGIIDKLVSEMKANNVKFVPNHSISAFYVDCDNGLILGDLSDRSTTYDFVILGDSLTTSRSILQRTHDENTGCPPIFKPLEPVLSVLNTYRPNTGLVSLKIWLSKRVFFQHTFMQISNSPYPYSIQSITQLTRTTIVWHWNTVLEVIVSGANGNRTIGLDKVFRELSVYLTDVKPSDIYAYRVDLIDTGVLMDTAYGANRMTTDSLRKAGIHNLILAGDWLDAINSTSFDLERSVEIASQALKGMTIF